MNRINQLFSKNPQKLLSLYFCAGAPVLGNTAEIIKTLEKKGVGMIEIGIPFSDPMADGPIIQSATTKALKNGMSLKKLFAQLENIRESVNIPLVMMGYLNPIIQYGFADYQNEFKPIAEKYDLRIIMLITPETSEERIRLIDENTNGFIYMVSSAATTGAQKSFDEQKQRYFNKVHAMHLKNPTMIGFGISNKQTFESACANANGAIIGSKFVQLLDEENGNADKAADRLFAALAE